jgi:hypothetical protein
MSTPGKRYLAVWPTEPEPGDLDEQVDWLTYSHQQLYDMVHNGVDLTGATHVAAGWATLAESLRAIGDRLGAELAASVHGWQGASADQARNAIGTLVSWAHDTGDAANSMAGCLARQVDNVQTARSAMPAPVPATVLTPPHEVVPPGFPVPGAAAPAASGGTQTSSADSFAAGPALALSPIGNLGEQQAAHQQAAHVMQQLQVNSRAVYTTVPQFAAPTSPVAGPRHAPVSPPPGPATPPGGGGGEPVNGLPVTGGSGRAGWAGGGAEPAPSARIGSSAQSGVADAVGRGAAGATTGEVAGDGRPGGAGGGMGGLGGARRSDEQERRTPKYLEEDQDIFEIDQTTTPPVIGG